MNIRTGEFESLSVLAVSLSSATDTLRYFARGEGEAAAAAEAVVS